MFNVGGNIIGLHDPDNQTIQFNGSFIGRQNVSFAFKSKYVKHWSVSIQFYYGNNSSITFDESDPTHLSQYCSIDSNGLFIYNKDAIESANFGTGMKIGYTNISVSCRAYAPDGDSYEALRFSFRYGQIQT